MFNCDISSCSGHVIITCLIILCVFLFFYLIFYLYLVYDTYMYHSDDIKSWYDTKLQKLYDN